MVRKSLIAAPLWAERISMSFMFLRARCDKKTTQILHYQVFSDHMPANNFDCSFRIKSRKGAAAWKIS
jgi:hypothetical protein